MSDRSKITFSEFGKGHSVSPELYGIFFEDINFSCDGGINANMVNNYSFDGVYFSNEELRAVEDPLRYWEMQGARMLSGKEAPLHENSKYAQIAVEGSAVLSNRGYNGLKAHRQECAMNIGTGREYLYECQLRNKGFAGEVKVRVVKEDGSPLTDTVLLAASEKDSWQKVSCTLRGMADGYGKLEIVMEGSGELDLDCVSLMDADYWNKEDKKWRYGRLRKDLIQSLADLKPAFMRFPGGCIVEGQLPGNEYNWKDTIGELYERKSNYSLWAEKIPDGGYNQSYQIGFFEYFCLCEDLGMKPLPTLTAGLNCQIRSVQRQEETCPNIPVDSEAFQSRVIDSYLDLIEFANGDPEENEWAAVRAKMGHPEPFGLERIGIGNENYGETYFERFALIEKAIHEKYPEMLCIFCGGVHPFYEDAMGLTGLASAHREAAGYQHVLVDEHSYHTPEWFAQQSVRFDGYDRKGAGVYFGEYAANGLLARGAESALSPEAALPPDAGMDEQGGMRPMDQANMLDTALGEAAFLTGVERNSDIVAMTSYAPLFNLVESDQWNHNLINFNPKTLCLSTNYYVQQMFSNHLGRRYLPYAGELPENVYLSATEDEQIVYVKLVNTGSAAVRTELHFQGKLVSASAIRLQSGNANIRNNLAFAGEAEYRIQPETYALETGDGCLDVELPGHSVQVITVEI